MRTLTEFHSCQILFPSIRINILDDLQKPSYARSRYPTQLANMSFDEILDLRPVLMGTVSLKFVFSGAIIISTWTLTGLVFEAFTMEQLLRSSKRYSPIRPSIPIFKSGAYLLELFKKSLHHRKSLEHKPCLISSQNYTCAAKNKHVGNSRCCFHLHRPHS